MHKLLERQLTRLRIPTDGTPPSREEWGKLLERVECAYVDADQDRYTLERSISLSSGEMTLLHENLRGERDKLRAIFESAALGILSVDPAGRVVDANPAATRMLGLPRHELVGSESAALFDETVPMTIPDAGSGGPELAERRYAHPGGATAWFKTTGTWVRSRDGAVQLGTIVLEDITEHKHLECSLRHAQKLESVGRLAAGIAHEINTPIQFVNDNVHFLKDAFEAVNTLVGTLREHVDAASLAEAEAAADWEYVGVEVPKSIAQTLEGLNRVATIVHSMKTFAYHDRGIQAPTDLNEAIASTLVVAGNELKNVAIAETDYGPIPRVTCCRGDLNQVFLNLIVNAAHAIRDVVGDTGALGRVQISTRCEGDQVAIAIADTGGGITDDVAVKMFEPFFTTKEVGHGSGQGLTLARGIVVNRHGGTIGFETKVGVGTTFTIRLPIAGADAIAKAA